MKNHWIKFNGKTYKGKKRGRGEYLLFNGDRIKCNFHNDLANGKGIFLQTDGTEIRGVWRKGKFIMKLKNPKQ